MKRIEFIKPTLELLPLENGAVDEFYCKLKVTPLERGYGMTIGNSLRRVLLSSLPGAAALAIKIEGVSHEFQAVAGIREDVTEIILNMKQVIFTINADSNKNGDFGDQDKIYKLELNASLGSVEEQKKAGVAEADIQYSRVVTAKEIDLKNDEGSDIKIVNPDQIICTLAAGGSLAMTILIRNGVGYVGASENKIFCKGDYARINNYIPIDSIFTPVSRCKYEVSKTRYLDNFDCDQLILEVWTNGSMLATNAVSLASRFLVQHFQVIEDLNLQIKEHTYIVEPEVATDNTVLDMRIEELPITTRSYNCLKRANINTVGELLQKSEEEMMKIKNLGRKSLKEIVVVLKEKGLNLKNSGNSTLFDDDDDIDDEDYDSSDDE